MGGQPGRDKPRPSDFESCRRGLWASSHPLHAGVGRLRRDRRLPCRRLGRQHVGRGVGPRYRFHSAAAGRGSATRPGLVGRTQRAASGRPDRGCPPQRVLPNQPDVWVVRRRPHQQRRVGRVHLLGASGESSCCRSPPLSVCSPRPGRGSCTGCADAPVFRLAELPIPAGAAPVHASGLLVVGGARLPADGVQRGLGSPNPET